MIDADTGRILSGDKADAMTYPASLTKMMTLYLTFKASSAGRLRLDTRLPVSVRAASRPPTKLGLRPGDKISVKNLILAIVTRSANDAAVVLAGSEPAFVARMNAEARRLGMRHTSFRNASGLPNPAQRTTARDMVHLALALYRDFPREYRFFAVRKFDFRGTEIVGHDHLLTWYRGTDGSKTGFIDASGYNIATSAVRDGHRLIGVVLGGTRWAARDRKMAALLDRGFAKLAGAAAAVARAAPRPALRSPAVVEAAALVLKRKPLPPKRSAHATAEADTGWSVQLAAFRTESTARKAARTAANLLHARGKSVQAVQPAGRARPNPHRFRVRFLRFSATAAEKACIALRKKRILCTVVPPAVQVAQK